MKDKKTCKVTSWDFQGNLIEEKMITKEESLARRERFRKRGVRVGCGEYGIAKIDSKGNIKTEIYKSNKKTPKVLFVINDLRQSLKKNKKIPKNT